MKRILILFFVLLAAGATSQVGAQTYKYMTFKQTDGAQVSLPADGLRLTFEGDKLVAVASGTTQSFSLVALSSMRFTEEAYSGNPYDLNLDGSVDIGDVTILVEAVLNEENQSAYDLNKDTAVDVSDVTLLVNYVLTQDASGN